MNESSSHSLASGMQAVSPCLETFTVAEFSFQLVVQKVLYCSGGNSWLNLKMLQTFMIFYVSCFVVFLQTESINEAASVEQSIVASWKML